MATFEKCMDELDKLQGFLEARFNEALYATRVQPTSISENAEYYFDVAFKSDLNDEERALIGGEFNGVPVTTRIISPGYIARKTLE